MWGLGCLLERPNNWNGAFFFGGGIFDSLRYSKDDRDDTVSNSSDPES